MEHIYRGRRIYDIGGTYGDKPDAGSVILRIPVPRRIQFPKNMEESQMSSDIAANAESVFILKKEGIDFATITFAAGEKVATFICSVTTNFIKGEELTLVSPNPQDADLEHLGFVFAAVRKS